MSDRTTSATGRWLAVVFMLGAAALVWHAAGRLADAQITVQLKQIAQQQALQQIQQQAAQQMQQAAQRQQDIERSILALQQEAQQAGGQYSQQMADRLKALQQARQQAVQQAQQAAAQQQQIQQAILQLGGLFAGSAGGAGVLLPTDRTAGLKLQQAEELINKREYSDAVGYLGALLESGEDLFFAPPGGSSSMRSVKAHALELIGSLPPAGREVYELQFGARAQRLLDEALASGDVEKLEAAARQYLHTSAGYEAAFLVGLTHLDHNRPLAAALEFQKLADTPQASQRFGPTLDVLAATSWQRSGMTDRARQTLAALKKKSPQASVEIAGRQVTLFSDSTDALDWLHETVGEMSLAAAAPRDEWTMFRGDPARNAISQGGRPLLSPRWRVRIANHPTLEQTIDSLLQSYTEQDLAALPALHPLAVGGVVIVRTLDGLVAVDFKTGKRIWEVRPRSAAAGAGFASAVGEGGGQQAPLAMALHSRLWEDETYGSMSSDGERVFFLDAGAPQPNSAMNVPRGVRLVVRGQQIIGGQLIAGGDYAQLSNRLVAVDLATEGKLLWEAGGPDDSSELAGANFLGAPLPLGGTLYALVEINNGVRLVAMDAKTGALQWSQHLADLETNVWQDSIRRAAGASPSYADGVMVCPLAAGVVLAVDLVDRSLLWAYHYERNTTVNTRSSAQPLMAVPLGVVISVNQQQLGNLRWADSSATIADGRVILTPADSDMMHCMSLIDGELKWSLPRGSQLYVAGVHDGKVILVGRTNREQRRGPEVTSSGATSLTAVDLDSGELVNSVVFPDEALPSGRGYMSGDSYYLPLSSGEVAQIDLSRMQIVQRAKSRDGAVPGNLICYQDEVISQSFDFVETFYQVEPLRERAQAVLRNDPNDAAALTRMGELLLDEGKRSEAIDYFRRSYASAPNDLTKELLVSNLMIALRDDFSAHRDAAIELEGIIDNPTDRNTLLRLMADGLAAEKDFQGALANYLKLVDVDGPANEMEQVGASHFVQSSRWIRAQLSEIRKSAGPQLRASLDATVAVRAEKALHDSTTAELSRFLDYFADFDASAGVRLELARRKLRSGALLEAEFYVLPLLSDPRPEIRGPAVATYAEVLVTAGRPEQAVPFYEQLGGELADAPCDGELTGRQIVEAAGTRLAEWKRLALPPAWPVGAIEVKMGGEPSPEAVQKLVPTTPISITPSDERFGDARLVLDGVTGSIVSLDGLGRRRREMQWTPSAVIYANNAKTPGLSYGATHGHLAVVFLGGQIAAFDTLGGPSLGESGMRWSQDLARALPTGELVMRTRNAASVPPNGTTRRIATNSAGATLGWVGPVSENGVVVQRLGELMCIDPATGETLWRRDDVMYNGPIWGDGEVVFLTPEVNGLPYVGDEAPVYRVLDGKYLGTRPVPTSSQQLTTMGRNVVQFQQTGNSSSVSMVEPWERREIWRQEFGTGFSIYSYCAPDLLAAANRSGDLKVVDLKDGRLLVDQKLEPRNSLNRIVMLQDRERIYLFALRPRNPSEGTPPAPMSTGAVQEIVADGKLFAFDRRSGKRVWQSPASIDGRTIPFNQHPDLPVLAFLQLDRGSNGNQQETTVSVLCIDKRTGEMIMDKQGIHYNSPAYAVDGDPDENTVNLLMSNVNFAIHFTAEPAPPAPPYRSDLSKRDAPGDGLLNVLRLDRVFRFGVR